MERLQALTQFCQYKLDRLDNSEPNAAQLKRVADLYSGAVNARVSVEHVLTICEMVPDLKRTIADLSAVDMHKVSELSLLCDQLDVFLFGVPKPAFVYGFSPSQLVEVRQEMWSALKFPVRLRMAS